ncbi:hypothetical protein [Leifsonia sp. AG29]|uniref:hypothetical protein n=1 Tax=Leifsonia sp. AG29 TaxID=2598860 RepID=UPI00131E1F68|nr:hypothetical protein [Leifsonia sp. AG29]
MRPRSRLRLHGLLAGALAVGLTAGAPGTSWAVGDPDRDGDGRLVLTPNVLVNESAGIGGAGDFPVRSRLFIDDVAERADARRQAAAARLDVVSTLTFSRPPTSGGEYRALKARLFDGYAARSLSVQPEDRRDGPISSLAVLAICAPLVALTGAAAGRLWARRRRASP